MQECRDGYPSQNRHRPSRPSRASDGQSGPTSAAQARRRSPLFCPAKRGMDRRGSVRWSKSDIFTRSCRIATICKVEIPRHARYGLYTIIQYYALYYFSVAIATSAFGVLAREKGVIRVRAAARIPPWVGCRSKLVKVKDAPRRPRRPGRAALRKKKSKKVLDFSGGA